jgi:hypothetical protein
VSIVIPHLPELTSTLFERNPNAASFQTLNCARQSISPQIPYHILPERNQDRA